MMKHLKKIIGVVVIIFILAGAYVLGGPVGNKDSRETTILNMEETGKTDDQREETKSSPLESFSGNETTTNIENETQTEDGSKQEESGSQSQYENISEQENSSDDRQNETQPARQHVSSQDEKSEVENSQDVSVTKEYEYLTGPSVTRTQQETQAAPSKPSGSQNQKPQLPQKRHCVISISCRTILPVKDSLDKNVRKLLPSDGWILPSCEVELKDGDTVFSVLQRVCKEKGISMEFSYTPLYGSNYIEGINQLYEFDAGNLSGWMYCVNGEFVNYGCSAVSVEDGDIIRWEYTCILG